MVLGSEACLSKAEARQPARQPAASKLSLIRRRDFEGRERDSMEEASSSSDARRSQKQRGARSQSAQQSKSTHTRTHTRALPQHTAQHHHVFPSPLVLLSASLYRLRFPFFFALSPLASRTPQERIVTLAPSEQSRLLPGIATSTSNATSTAEACVVCQRARTRQRFPRLRSACLC